MGLKRGMTRKYWRIIAAALAILVYSALLQIFVWNSPPSYEDQFWMYPRLGWNALQDLYFVKQDQPITSPILSGLIWMPLDWLATLVGGNPMDSIFLIALVRMWIATLALFLACLMVVRCYTLKTHLVVVACFVSLILSSTFIFEQYLRFSGRYASLVIGCLAIIAFASEIRLSKNQLKYSRGLTGAGTILLIPSLATNAANALATLVTLMVALFWSLSLAPLRRKNLLVFLSFATAIAAALVLPVVLQGGTSTWNGLADLRQDTQIFATTSWLEVLQGRGVWWERNYLTWSDQLDEPFRVWIRLAIVLLVVSVIPILVRPWLTYGIATLKYELMTLKAAPRTKRQVAASSGVLCLLVTIFISLRTQTSVLMTTCIAVLAWWVTNVRWEFASTDRLAATDESRAFVGVLY